VPSTFCGRQAKKTKAADSLESTAYMFFVVVMGRNRAKTKKSY
jgi:hypothetical protein